MSCCTRVLVAGQPAQGIELDLGVGAVLTRASFVFWSKGTIWSAPKEGGVTARSRTFRIGLRGRALYDSDAGRARASETERRGRTPALLTGGGDVYYYDVDKLEIRRLSSDGHGEGVIHQNVVCSPIHAATEIYCGSVEGLFQVSKETHQPRVLSYGRPGFITNIRSNSKHVVWTVDIGREALAVDMLPAPSADRKTVPTS